MMKRGIVVVFILLSLAACAGIKGASLSSESLDQTAVEVHRSSLTDQDKSLFDELKGRADNGEYDVTGKTVGQAISDEAAYDADQKAQRDREEAVAAAARQRHSESIAAMQHVLTVALVDKGFHDADIYSGDYQSAIEVQFALRNNGRKTIKALKGVTEFDNSLGDKIYSTNLEHDIVIPPGRSVTWVGSVEFNQFDRNLVELRDTATAHLRFHFIPKVILFADGSRLEEQN